MDEQEKLSSIQIQTYFVIKDAEDETVASLRSEMRHGVRFINSLWVSPKHREQRHGSSLLKSVINEFGVTQDLYLHIHAYTNEPLSDNRLYQWYKKFGFQSIPDAHGMLKRPAGKLELDMNDYRNW
jgi:N-acetylglutamate synthase-like GNAT family acetyltransferase